MVISLISENPIIVSLIIILDVWLGYWVYSADSKSRINRHFTLLTFLLSLWALFCYLKSIVPLCSSLVLVRAAYAIVALFFIPFHLFLKYFPKEERKPLFISDKFILLLCLFLAFFSFHHSLVEKVKIVNGTVIPLLGIGRFIYLPLISLLLIYVVSKFIIKYFKLSYEEKLKAQYFFIGLILFVLVNFIFNIIIPLFYGTTRYSCIGNHSAIFLLAFTAYAIVKRELFGIKVILTELLVGVMGTILLVLPFVIKTTLPMRILMIGVFFVYCFIGYLLIKSTLREVRQKEILEEKVKERTRDLEKAKDIAEQRAREIEKRKADLEHFYKLTVGRELKMIELKKRIRDLEGKKEEKAKER